MADTAGSVLAIVLGLVVGSFLNVVRYRLPRKIGMVCGRSTCPGCGSTIAWYDNIPLASFIALRGRCRHCGRWISGIYPVIEAATGVTFLLIWLFADPREIAPFAVLASILIASAGIDFDLRIIPDRLTLPGIVLGVVFSVTLLGRGSVGASLLHSALGMVVGGGSLLVIALIYKTLRKIEGMGGGDIKLMAMVGAFLGWAPALLTIFVGSVLGAVVGIVLIARSGKGLKTSVPFGVFLCPAAIAVMLWGGPFLSWYSNLLSARG
jgi:leader peptidase (prepilin peptidase)/N-methyltransferase